MPKQTLTLNGFAGGLNIDSDESDKCRRRYSFKGDILSGIAEYIKVVKLIQRKRNEDSNSWK